MKTVTAAMKMMNKRSWFEGMDMTCLLRITDVMTRMGLKKSSIYNMVNDGTLTQPVKMGKRTSVWPDDEVQAIIQALIGNKSQEDMKSLVDCLMKQRNSQKVSRL